MNLRELSDEELVDYIGEIEAKSVSAEAFVSAAARHYAELKPVRDRSYDAFLEALELAARDCGYWSATEAVRCLGGHATEEAE